MKMFDTASQLFSDQRLLPKFGIVYGVNFILSLISVAVTVVTYILQVSFEGNGAQSQNPLLMLLISGLPLVINLLTLPIWLYPKGYFYEIVNRVRLHRDNPDLAEDLLPEHEDPRKTISVGGTYLSASLAFGMPIGIMMIASIMLGSSFVSQAFMTGDLALGLAIGAAILVVNLLFGLAMFLNGKLLVPAFMYLFFKKGSFHAAVKPRAVWEILKAAWWRFLLIGIVMFLIRIAFWVVKIVLICFGIFVRPALDTISLILEAGMLGSVYADLDEVVRG